MILRLLNSSLFLSYIFFRINFILLASNTRITTVFGFSNETDQRALIAIKDLIPGDQSRVLGSWNHSLHFCHWQGVICSPRHQRVTELNLSALKLVGSLSPHIGNLTFLRAIYLENNSFHGTIPQEMGRLFRLQYLYLNNNTFQGEFPANLSNCFNIRVINLHDNNLEGKIPTELGSLSYLLDINLSKNQFTGPIPPSFGNLSSLRTFITNYNNLEGEIPFELGQLSNLESFQMASNNLSGMVPPTLFNISSIYSFAVAVNQLHGNLPLNLGLTLPKLQEFYFGDNNFSGSFPPSISNVSGLAIFDISWNSFTGHVPMNLGSNGNLELLNLIRNQLGTNKPDDLSWLNSLANCSNLRILQLTKNGFGGVFPDSIVNLSTELTSLRLDGNYISGSIPREIGNLINLQRLAFNENMLRGSIPESIGKLSKLQGLYLYTNNISGEIPSSIGNITQLTVIALQENMLEGSMPVAMGNCKNLQGLDLQRNRLTGVIPEQIIGLSSITTLNLNLNHLTGPLPSLVGNLKNLGQLDISGNKLSGEIPSSLGECQMLEMLFMQDNLFEGTIPSSFQQLKSIQVLELSRNNLSGQIPGFLGNLSLIQVLNLSFNMFEGEVPEEGVFGNTSLFSVGGNMKLCGGMQALGFPQCPTKVPKKGRKPFPLTLLPLVIILPIVLLLACLSGILYRLRRSKQQNNPDESLLPSQYPRLSYAELLQATNGFSSTNLVGEGSYGSVYKGILNSGGQIVAVKVLNLQQRGSDKSFLAECETLRNIRHRNLIKIITACSTTDFKGSEFKALVFEFMPSGSLDSWLHQSPSEQQNKKNLNLLQRLNIAIDVASAMEYLHHHCETTITHCDLKPSNVLLDNELCARVGDFGLARFHLAPTSQSNQAQTSSIGIRGTVGYVAPEYGMGEEVSAQGDVYSYEQHVYRWS